VTRFLKKLLPQRIASQIAALVVTSLVLAHVVTTLTIFLLNPHPNFMNSPGATTTRLAFTAKLLDATSNPDARADILRAAREGFPGMELREPGKFEGRPADDPFLRDLQTDLGYGFKVFGSRLRDSTDRAPKIGIQLPNGETLLAPLPGPSPGPRGPTPALIGTLVFLASAIALLSLWAAKTLTAPLTRFADAAERFTLGRSDAPLPERGPKEIVRAARALNGMRDRIQRLVEDRARMLAAVGHDLRTPITRLRLRAEDIAQEPLRKDVVRDLETMQNMVHSALSFLRDQATKSALVTIDLPSVVQTICDGFGDLGRNVAFDGPSHLYVEGDPDQLARAVTNLVENGLKFATSVTVRLAAGSAGDVHIEVEDDGPGIPESEKQRVLEPFYRGDSARSLNGHDSFGLGLSISRVIVEAHNGTLELRDAEPRGLLVRLTLPRTVSRKPNSTKPRRAMSQG
jgi:signal transduction histidine kinase